MLDSSDAFTPDPAVCLPLVRSAGQFARHSLIFAHVFRLRGSRVKRYSVNPLELTRIAPRLVRCSWTVAPRAARAVEVPWPALAGADAHASGARGRRPPAGAAAGGGGCAGRALAGAHANAIEASTPAASV